MHRPNATIPPRPRGQLGLAGIAIFFLLGCGTYCQCGGGFARGSATSFGWPGTQVLERATGGDVEARVELEREYHWITGGMEVTYLIPKLRIAIEKRLVIDRAGRADAIEMGSDDFAVEDLSPKLAVSDDGAVVAFSHMDKPWRIVHVFDDQILESPTRQEKLDLDAARLQGEELETLLHNWKVTSFRRGNIDLLRHLLIRLRDTEGQRPLAKEVFSRIRGEDDVWRKLHDLLDEDGREEFARLIREHVSSPDRQHPMAYRIAYELDAIELDGLPVATLKNGAHALTASSETATRTGNDLAEYLRLLVREDPAEAGELACHVVGWPHDAGRPLQLVALAVLATSKRSCEALAEVEADRCGACEGEVCSEAELTRRTADVLARAVAPRTPEELDLNPQLVAPLVVAAEPLSPVCD